VVEQLGVEAVDSGAGQCRRDGGEGRFGAFDTGVDDLVAAFDESVGVEQKIRAGRQGDGGLGSFAVGGDGKRY